jgi:cell division protein FtsB
MSFARALRRRVRAAIPPLIFLSLVGYFGWNATQGDLGLQAYAKRQSDLAAAQASLVRATAEQEVWERRIASLRPNHLDPDALDERARAMLNLAHPNDVVVLYGPPGKPP